MIDPGHYQVLTTDGFEKDLAVIETAMRLKGDAVRHEQVNQHISRLDDLRRDPRHQRHWTQRILVYRGEAGDVLWRDRVAADADLDESDFRRLEYVIEERLDIEDALPRRQWGLIVTFYQVDDEDRKVVLLSIHLMVTSE